MTKSSKELIAAVWSHKGKIGFDWAYSLGNALYKISSDTWLAGNNSTVVLILVGYGVVILLKTSVKPLVIATATDLTALPSNTPTLLIVYQSY